MLNRPDEMAIYGKLARGRAKGTFSWEAIASQTLDVYHDALRERANSYLESRRTF